MAVTLIVGASNIEKAVKSIGTRGKKLDADIQLAGLSVLDHIEKHGDVTLASRLYDALPKGARRNALAEWMLQYGKLRVLDPKDAQDKERLASGLHFGHDKLKVTDLAGAEAKAWHEFKPEKSVQAEFNVQDKALRLVLDSIKHGVAIADLLAAVQAVAASEKAQAAMKAQNAATAPETAKAEV